MALNGLHPVYWKMLNPTPACQREVPHHITGMRKSQLTNYYGNNDRLMPNGDPRIFELPCRFPAAPSIRPKSRVQGFDQKRLSIPGEPQKIS
jgi:hypothetical protein